MLESPVPGVREADFGLEVGIPLIRGMMGWNEGYFSYGLQVEIWLIKVLAGFYGVEIGGGYKDQQSKRALVYVSLLDFSFDSLEY